MIGEKKLTLGLRRFSSMRLSEVRLVLLVGSFDLMRCNVQDG